MRDSFVFYKSFWEAIKELPPEDREKSLYVIMEYAINGKEDSEITGIPKAVFTLVKPQIDVNNKKYENGKKGGRPTHNQRETIFKPKDNQPVTKEEPTHNQEETKPEPNVNVNDNDNDNVNDNERENSDNIYISKSLPEEIPPPSHFKIPVEFHQRLNTRLALTTMPTPSENMLAEKLLSGIGDLDLVIKCLDAFFDDDQDWYFTRKSKKEPEKRVYHFKTFCTVITDLVSYVREAERWQIKAQKRREKEKVRASPPEVCPDCGGSLKRTLDTVQCKSCRKVLGYQADVNKWEAVA